MSVRRSCGWSDKARVSIPFGHSPDYDLVADLNGRLSRVQVKTSVCPYKARWAVTVCTRGGNRSWSGLVKRLDTALFDHLFVVVADGRQWFIPADRVEGLTAIHLGGPKYAEFEVERGDAIPLQSAPATARGDARAAKGITL